MEVTRTYLACLVITLCPPPCSITGVQPARYGPPGNRFSRNTLAVFTALFGERLRGLVVSFLLLYPTVSARSVHVTNEHTRHVHACQIYWTSVTRSEHDRLLGEKWEKGLRETGRTPPRPVLYILQYLLCALLVEYRATLTSTSARIQEPREQTGVDADKLAGNAIETARVRLGKGENLHTRKTGSRVHISPGIC